MSEEFASSYNTRFISRAPSGDVPFAVKFAQRRAVLDDWYLFDGTRWTRTLFRLKHPIVYGKRGIEKMWRKVKSLWVKERIVPCSKTKSE